MGSIASIHGAIVLQNEISSLVLYGAFTSPLHAKLFTKAKPFKFHHFNNYYNIMKVKNCPITILHSFDDTWVNINSAKRLCEAAKYQVKPNNKKEVERINCIYIEGLPHNLNENPESVHVSYRKIIVYIK